MSESNRWISASDGIRLFVRRWEAEGPLRGLVHIVHGMAGHSRNYGQLARRLSGAGFEVWAADMRGHGQTASAGGNEGGRGGLPGHCADEDAFSRVLADIDEIHRTIGEQRPGLPLFLLGHSWGSILAQGYIENYRYPLAGCILSGTRGPGGVRLAAGARIIALLALFLGCRRRSRLVQIMVEKPFNRPFRPNRTSYDWLSRDEKAVDALMEDPLRCKLCTVGFYRDLTRALCRIHQHKDMERIDRDLPIYVFSGSADPVGDMGNGPTALVGSYRSMGFRDLEFVLYPDARHEILSETNREEVAENLISWLSRHTSGGI